MSTTQDDANGLGMMAVIAIQVVVAVAVWGLAGLLLDLLLDTSPWLQFAGIVLGTMIALALAQRQATAADDEEAAHV